MHCFRVILPDALEEALRYNYCNRKVFEENVEEMLFKVLPEFEEIAIAEGATPKFPQEMEKVLEYKFSNYSKNNRVSMYRLSTILQ